MVNLIIQKKNRYNNKKNFSLLGKNSGLTPLASNWVFCVVGEGTALLVGQFGEETTGEFVCLFVCFFGFPWSYGPSIPSRSTDVVLPDDWLVSSIWFLLPTEQVAIRT
jgi:hypothetical protein